MTFRETGWTSQWVRAMLEIHKARSPILDVCCTGSVYASKIPEHAGIDLTFNSVTLDNQKFQLMNALHMDFEDGEFKTVIAHNVLPYIGYASFGHEAEEYGPEKLILECLRVTAEKGLFLFTCPVGNSHTIKGPMGVVKNYSLAEYRALSFGGDVVNETFYVREPSRYKRVGAHKVAGFEHNGFQAGAVACAVILRSDVELPELKEFAKREVEVPDAREPISPELEEFAEDADIYNEQLQRARMLGHDEE